MSDQPIGIIKIGGSLLSRPAVVDQLLRWEAENRRQGMMNFWLVGGGRLVDAMRSLDRTLQLSASLSHCSSIELMDLSVRLLAEKITWPWAENRDAIQAARYGTDRKLNRIQTGNFWLQPAKLIRELEDQASGPVARLPRSWDVTSDSIAVWLGIQLQADRVVLLKSCPVDSDRPGDWLNAGIVDRYFGELIPAIDDTLDDAKIEVVCRQLPE